MLRSVCPRLLLVVGMTVLAWNSPLPAVRAQQPSHETIPGIPVPLPPAARTGPAVHAAPPPANDGEIISQGTDKLVLVEGHEKDGSGFICDLGDGKFLITNAHVLAGNTSLRFTRLDGASVNVGAAGSAVGHDMVRLAVAPDAAAFTLLDHVDENLRVGDSVIVLGNAEGARVVTPITGRVVGLGPNLVEVDAPFLPGNSGSPIIHQRTGKVIGIATYVVREKEESPRPRPGGGGNAPEGRLRRFGYRLDSVKTWQPVAWPEFQAEAAEMNKIDQRTNDLVAFLKALGQGRGRIRPGMSGNPALEPALDAFIEAMQSRPSPTDALAARRRLLDDLRRASQSDLAALRPRLRYDYFQHAADEKQHVRDALAKDFESMTNAQANTTGR